MYLYIYIYIVPAREGGPSRNHSRAGPPGHSLPLRGMWWVDVDFTWMLTLHGGWQAKLLSMIIENFIPGEEHDKIKGYAYWDEEVNDWRLEHQVPLISRRPIHSGYEHSARHTGYEHLAVGRGKFEP